MVVVVCGLAIIAADREATASTGMGKARPTPCSLGSPGAFDTTVCCCKRVYGVLKPKARQVRTH